MTVEQSACRAGVHARAAALALLGIAACSSLNARTNSYATLAEARDAGAVAQGWVPDGLPPGSREIRVAYVPDGPQRWGIVNFPEAEGPVLKALLGGEISLQGVKCDIPPRFEWWPLVLRGDLDAQRIQDTGLRAYRARQGELIFAVNWNQGRAYYWLAQ